MEQLSLFEEREEYQPRFQAYLDYVGANHKDEVQVRDFMRWIDKHIDDYRKTVNLNKFQPMLDHHHDGFTKYLQSLQSGK